MPVLTIFFGNFSRPSISPVEEGKRALKSRRWASRESFEKSDMGPMVRETRAGI